MGGMTSMGSAWDVVPCQLTVRHLLAIGGQPTRAAELSSWLIVDQDALCNQSSVVYWSCG